MKKRSLYIILLSCCISGYSQQTDTVKLVTAFGKPNGQEVVKKIGKEGGTLVSEDGKVELIIPPGALNKKINISMQPVTSTMPAVSGKSYHLQPSGIIFEKPVNIIFHYNDKEQNSNDPQLRGIAMQDEKGQWHDLTNIILDTINKTISGKINHFSYWVDYEKVSITPSAARVRVNKEISVQLNIYSPPTTDDDEFPPLPPISIVTVSGVPLWSANGIKNGNQKMGTIRNSNDAFTKSVYKAPASVPDQNAVAVTAELKNLNFKIGNKTFNNLKVTSNILVYNDSTYEVKLEGWVDQTSLMCGQRAVDEGRFFVQVQGDHGKVMDIQNALMTIPVRSTCLCSQVWINESTCLGPIHIAAVQWIKVIPPNPPAQANSHVQILFKPSMGVFPIFQNNCAAGGNFPPLPAFAAIPRMIDFFTKREEQVILEIKESMLGFRITVKPVEDN